MDIQTPDTINPNLIPQRTLRGGDKMPAIGMGTFGSDRFSAEQVSAAVKGAAEVGYRLFDCASVYGNEPLIGNAFRDIIASGIRREELFITSKVWNDMHGHGDVLLSCAQTLKDLGLEYIDMYFVHWPFPNFHPKGAAPDYHNHDARPYIHERYMETWYQMERLVQAGLVRHIGTSNMTIPKLKLVLRDCRVMPSANEMELHPSFQQNELFRYCTDAGIQPIGYSPIGSPNRPERDKTPQDVVDMEDVIVNQVARNHNIHPALVCLKWAVQRGQVPIPFSVNRTNYAANLRCITQDPLSDAEMQELAGSEQNCRLIKGQVFLWDGAKDWHDLWDEDGTIKK